MTGEVLPFPLARRIELIQRQADYALSLRPLKGEQHIARQIEYQAKVMRNRGIADHIIKHEVAAMDAAIRAAMWHAVMDAPSENS